MLGELDSGIYLAANVPGGGVFWLTPRSLIVLIVYDHFGKMSTKNFPKKPVDKYSIGAII